MTINEAAMLIAAYKKAEAEGKNPELAVKEFQDGYNKHKSEIAEGRKILRDAAWPVAGFDPTKHKKGERPVDLDAVPATRDAMYDIGSAVAEVAKRVKRGVTFFIHVTSDGEVQIPAPAIQRKGNEGEDD